MIAQATKQMATKIRGLIPSPNSLYEGITKARMILGLTTKTTNSEENGPEKCWVKSEARSAGWKEPGIKNDATPGARPVPGPAQAAYTDGRTNRLLGLQATRPAGDSAIDWGEYQEQQLKLELQSVLQQMKKNREFKLEEQRIEDMISSLSQNGVFEKLENVQILEDPQGESTLPPPSTPNADNSATNRFPVWKAVPIIVLGAGVAAIVVPGTLTMVGFTSSGIAGKSLAAYLMKCSAIYYGGGVPAGGVVATCQSLGATAGISYVNASIGGAAVYYKLYFGKKDGNKKKKD